MGKKEQVSNKQLGFYLSKNGEKLRIHADTGDRMIRPPRPRHRRTGSTPYKEVQAYMRELKSWEAGAGQVSTVNDNGGGTIFDVDLHWVRVSPVGEEGDPHNSAGFMMWDTAYSQYYFTKTLWPDFTPEEFRKSVAKFIKTERRIGK